MSLQTHMAARKHTVRHPATTDNAIRHTNFPGVPGDVGIVCRYVLPILLSINGGSGPP